MATDTTQRGLARRSDYVHTYAFDDAGNRESWLKDTDPAFGTTGTGYLTFDVQSFAAEVTVTYDYDANDRLLTETLDAPGAADDRHTVYDWDGGGSTMQLDKVVYDTLDDTGDVLRAETYAYAAPGRMAGTAIDADGAGSAEETTTTYTYDDHGIRVRQLADALAELVQAATKDAAAVLKLDYTAYGTAVNYAAESVATALLHNGEFVDPVTGQQYLRARWYDQSSGRFNRVDPFAGEASIPQSLHKYLFAHGDPVTGFDPEGEAVHWVITAVFSSAVLGVVFAVAENTAGGTAQQQWSAGLAGLGAGLAIGSSFGAPGYLSPVKVLASAAINGLAYALAYIAVEKVIRLSQPSGADIILQFANGVSDGALSELTDQINFFSEGTRKQILLQTLYAPLYNAFSSISASLLTKEPIDWNKLLARFVVDMVSAFFSQSEFSTTWFAKVGAQYTGAEERVITESLAAFFKNPESVSTALSSFVAAMAGQFF